MYTQAIEIVAALPDMIDDVNDAIELRQSFLVIQAFVGRASGQDSESKAALAQASKANQKALEWFGKLIKDKGLKTLLGQVRGEYIEPLFELLVASNSFKFVDEEDLQSLLVEQSGLLQIVCAQKKLVDIYGNQIACAMRQSPIAAAELMLERESDHLGNAPVLFLPKSIDSTDLNRFLEEYIASPSPHPNKLALIQHWMGSGPFSITPEVRAKATAREREIWDAISEDGAVNIHKAALEVAFSCEQEELFALSMDDECPRITYSGSWLMDTLDGPSILNNLIHVFGALNRFGYLTSSIPMRGGQSLFDLFRIRGVKDYAPSLAWNTRWLSQQLSLSAYESFLLQHGQSLEAVVNWFFNEYIADAFGVRGFRCDLLTPDRNALEKCVTICAELERVVKEYHLFAKTRSIDADLFNSTRRPPYAQIASLDSQKNLYGEGQAFKTAARLLFSEASIECLPLEQQEVEDSLLDWFLKDPNASLAESLASNVLEELISKGLVRHEEEELRVTDKALLFKCVWDNGVLWPRMFDEAIRNTIDSELNAGEFVAEGTLLSRDEADLFNYFLGNTYGDSRALRNKYSHGAPPNNDPNAEEFERDYECMLSLMLMLVLKMGEEMRVCLGYSNGA